MDALSFVYWLNGYFEINNITDQTLSAEQVKIIKDHISLVLSKTTPNYEIKSGDFVTHPILGNISYLNDGSDFIPHRC